MSNRKNRVSALVVAGLALVTASATAAGSLDAANAGARRFAQETMKERRIPGMQVAVVKGGRIGFSESYGLANVENRVAVTGTTVFPINSATKSFTGVAMMQLEEAGLVDVDAPVSRYLDGLPEAWNGIRVRQLLAHTSGLPDILDADGLLGGGSESDAWTAVERLPMDAPMGERFAYNQTNYALLSRIIVRLTGKPFERFIAARQFDPTGMRSSTFGDSYDLIPDAATMYSYFPRSTDDGGGPERLSHWFYDMPPGLWAGGGIQTTADEVARWMIALSGGRLIKAENLTRMWTPERLNNGDEGSWSAGWPVLQGRGHRRIAAIGGARAAFIVYPEAGVSVIVLTNLVGSNPQDFIPGIAAFYLPPGSGNAD